MKIAEKPGRSEEYRQRDRASDAFARLTRNSTEFCSYNLFVQPVNSLMKYVRLSEGTKQRNYLAVWHIVWANTAFP